MMNCRKAEQLIPLFVEIDLDAAEMQQVTAHVETCHSCRALIAEFQASQASLHAVALPAFDEAMLTEMRSTVMQRVAPPAMRPPFVEWLQPIWSWKWTFVAATAVLVLASSFVMSRRRTETNPGQIGTTAKGAALSTATQAQSETTQKASHTHPVFQPRTGRKNKAQGEVSVSERNPGNNVRRQPRPERATDVDHQIAASASSEAGNDVAILLRVDTLDFTLPPAPQAETGVLPALPNLEKSASEPEMLRMEFQTADPNIRIIWLTPKSALAAK